MNSAPEVFFFGLIGLLTVAWLLRELPLQYVITVLIVMAVVAAVGRLMVKTTCWWLPILVLNSRGVSRFALRKWTDRAYYGWWVIGMTCVLSTGLAPSWSTPMLALLMQIAATPWLVKRRPGNTPSYLPILTFAMMAAGGLLGFFVLPL